LTRIRRQDIAVVVMKITHQLSGAETIMKERSSQKEDKKKPVMTPKEKKAAKRSKKESRDFLGNDRTR
jgi:hypothetical protein